MRRVYVDGSGLAAIEQIFLDAALADNTSMVSLYLRGHLPAMLPRQLQFLRVDLCQQDGRCNGRLALPRLLVSLQLCSALRCVYLCLWDFSLVLLSKDHLQGLHLSHLETLHLVVGMSQDTVLDLSWLALPRSFSLSLRASDSSCFSRPSSGGPAVPQQRVKLLTEAYNAIQPQDTLSLVLCLGTLLPNEQQVLGSLHISRFVLELAPQLLTCLPHCASIDISFGSANLKPVTRGEAQLTWAALTTQAGDITLRFSNWQPGSLPALRVIGCPPGSMAPATAEPWQLRVLGAQVLGGLPPASFAADGVNVLQNEAADRAGWTASSQEWVRYTAPE